MEETGTILLVEDSEDDVFLMKRALKAAAVQNPVQLAEDGSKAINYLSGAGQFSNRATHPLPKVVFLDLKLPIKNGVEVLKWIRNQPQFQKLPVIILTSSSEPKDSSQTSALGADYYMVKPPTGPQILELAKIFNWTWLARA